MWKKFTLFLLKASLKYSSASSYLNIETLLGPPTVHTHCQVHFFWKVMTLYSDNIQSNLWQSHGPTNAPFLNSDVRWLFNTYFRGYILTPARWRSQSRRRIYLRWSEHNGCPHLYNSTVQLYIKLDPYNNHNMHIHSFTSKFFQIMLTLLDLWRGSRSPTLWK